LSVTVTTSIFARSVAESSVMSSQSLVAEAVSLPSSRAAAASQSDFGEDHHLAPSTVTRESLHDSIDAINKLSISGAHDMRHAADITFEEAAADIRTVNESFYRTMVHHYEATKKVRSDELQWMRKIQNYHWGLERFPAYVIEKKLSQAETDRQMDKHSAQLLEYDMQLKAWFNHRGQENVGMIRCNNRAVEENVRRYQENVRREEHDRRGHSRWFKDHDRWLLDSARRTKDHNRWVQEYNFWVRTFDRFSQERSRNLKEYRELFTKQAHFSRTVGNYQVFRFFEEVEALNDAADSVKKSPYYASEHKDNEEAWHDHQNHVEGRIVETDALSDGQGSFDDEMDYMETTRRRRYTL
jgi:hypothetical protein